MKADAARIRASVARPPADIRLYLLHGPDEAGARSLGSALANALGADLERIDIEPTSLRQNPGRLVDEAAALSLFGNARLVRITGAGEETAEALSLLLAAERVDAPVLVIAPAVRTSARIVKLAIDSPRALAFACYEPSARDAEQIATTLAREAGLQPDPGIARRLADAANNDRAIMAREVEKIALFLDAAPDRPARLDGAVLDTIGADLADPEQLALADALLDGDTSGVASQLAELAGGGNAVSWLRAIERQLIAIADMRAEVDAGEEVGSVIKRRRIHFSREAATRAALGRWTAERVARALDEIRRITSGVMAPGNAGDVLARHDTVTLARRVRASR